MALDFQLKVSKMLDTIVIGAGFSGIGAAIRLKKAGIENFVILERKNEIGGTWRDNTYPGCACDIPSFLYCYSFEPNPNWSASFSPHYEILAYLKKCIDKYALASHIHYNCQVKALIFQENTASWDIRTNSATTYHARTVISCSGPLNEPIIPSFKDQTKFKGKSFHSLNWDHDYDLINKRVGVIGTGASAIQFIPKIAPKLKQLTIFQRTPPWIEPKVNVLFSKTAKRHFHKFPIYLRFWREFIYWILELRGLSQYKNNKVRAWRKKKAIKHLKNQISDPSLVQKLLPAYEIGCKRVLISNDYYPTLNRKNTQLETNPIACFVPEGIRTENGKIIPLDAIIYGTGFTTTRFSHIYDIIGRNQRNLIEEWNKQGAEAYKGINVSGFPNLLFVVGPNTGLGHNSIIHMMESQYKYIIDYLKKVLRTDPKQSFDLKPERQNAYNTELQSTLNQMVWNTGGCNSYYLRDGNGKNTSIWPGTTMKYRRQTKRIHLKDFNLLQSM